MKVYTTALTYEQVSTLLSQLQPAGKQVGFYQVNNYSAELVNTRFILRNAYPRQNLPAMPKIIGQITQEHPTTIHLQITPNYFLIAFLLLFPLVFIPSALFQDKWTIDGVYRAPVLAERLFMLVLGGALPLVWCYVGAIIPVEKAEEWIVKKLALHLQ